MWWKRMGGRGLLLASAFLLVLVACDNAREPLTAPEQATLQSLNQGRHVGHCRRDCLAEMQDMQRETDRYYRAVVKSCQGDPSCLRVARQMYEANLAELETDVQDCVDACK